MRCSMKVLVAATLACVAARRSNSLGCSTKIPGIRLVREPSAHNIRRRSKVASVMSLLQNEAALDAIRYYRNAGVIEASVDIA